MIYFLVSLFIPVIWIVFFIYLTVVLAQEECRRKKEMKEEEELFERKMVQNMLEMERIKIMREIKG